VRLSDETTPTPFAFAATCGGRFFVSVWLHGLCGRGGLDAAAVSVGTVRLPSGKRKVFFWPAISERRTKNE
jgi:hypothetical protein